ncbi:hypothetical protein HZA87_01765, partial [Candidatus Uhrbacteria bacterium]|nr:hypothetical protein [Candidatus Uhrbacteria bacterium]
RLLFESLWRTGEKGKKVTAEEIKTLPAPSPVPFQTRTASVLREFFLSRNSLIIFSICGVLAAAMTYGLYRHNLALNLQQMRVQAQGIASTAALQFDAKDLDQLRVESDWKKPQWAKVVNQLREIRENNKDIVYAYIIRKTSENSMEFVSDADSMNPYANSDNDPLNNVNVDAGPMIGTGAILLQWPGQKYNDAPKQTFTAYQGSTTTDILLDQWGTVLSGYAPIKDANGRVNAIMAVDIKADKLKKLSQDTFSPVLWFMLIFLSFVLIRIPAFNRSLFKGFV